MLQQNKKCWSIITAGAEFILNYEIDCFLREKTYMSCNMILPDGFTQQPI